MSEGSDHISGLRDGNAETRPQGDMKPVLVLLGGVAFLCVAGSLGFLLLGFGIRNHSSYKRVLEVADKSSAVTDVLGTNLVSELGARGIVRERKGVGFAHLKIPVRGTQGRGTLYAELTSAGGRWSVSDLALQHGSSIQPITLSTSPNPPNPRYLGKGTVYLLPLGELDIATLKAEAERIQKRFGIPLQVLPADAIDPSEEDPVRNQLIAENVIGFVRRAHPDLVDNYDAFVIAVTDRDLYIRHYDWNFAFGLRSAGRFAVISTARLGANRFDIDSPLVANVRLRKMLTKFIGILYFQLPLSVDPTSVLYGGIDGSTDIDFMTESFTGAFNEWKPMPGAVETCITLFASRDRPPGWRIDCTHEAPSDFGSGSFENSLGLGLFVQRHTDFRLGTVFPLAFQRMYRPEDERSRSFGIGTNHSFDIFLVGDSTQFTYIDLVQEDGSRVRFKRSRPGTGYADTVFYTREGSEFAGATLKWNGHGWDLKRLDGWTYVFPDANASSTPQQSALIAIHDDKGHAIRFVRDRRGILSKAVHFEGGELQFTYDAHDRITHAQDNQGRAIDYVYDVEGRLIKVSDNNGHVDSYTYDAANRMLKVWWDGKLELSNTYDKAGRVVRQVNGAGESFSYLYDSSNLQMDMAHFIRPDGYTSHFYFRSVGGTTQSLPQPPGAQAGLALNEHRPKQP